MTLAAQLDGQLAPVRPLSPLPDGLDVRWEGVDLERVLGEVRDFAAEARFDDFLAAQHDYIAAVEEAFRSFVRSRPATSGSKECSAQVNPRAITSCRVCSPV